MFRLIDVGDPSGLPERKIYASSNIESVLHHSDPLITRLCERTLVNLLDTLLEFVSLYRQGTEETTVRAPDVAQEAAEATAASPTPTLKRSRVGTDGYTQALRKFGTENIWGVKKGKIAQLLFFASFRPSPCPLLGFATTSSSQLWISTNDVSVY